MAPTWVALAGEWQAIEAPGRSAVPSGSSAPVGLPAVAAPGASVAYWSKATLSEVAVLLNIVTPSPDLAPVRSLASQRGSPGLLAAHDAGARQPGVAAFTGADQLHVSSAPGAPTTAASPFTASAWGVASTAAAPSDAGGRVGSMASPHVGDGAAALPNGFAGFPGAVTSLRVSSAPDAPLVSVSPLTAIAWSIASIAEPPPGEGKRVGPMTAPQIGPGAALALSASGGSGLASGVVAAVASGVNSPVLAPGSDGGAAVRLAEFGGAPAVAPLDAGRSSGLGGASSMPTASPFDPAFRAPGASMNRPATDIASMLGVDKIVGELQRKVRLLAYNELVRGGEELYRQERPLEARVLFAKALASEGQEKTLSKAASGIVLTFMEPAGLNIQACRSWARTNIPNEEGQQRVTLAIGELYYRNQDYGQAIVELEDLTKQKGHVAESASLVVALSLLGKGERWQAIGRLNKVATESASDETSAKAMFLVGWAYLQSQQYEAA
ncbi:MAG TPA: hypothetical protein P5137_17135, partial [Candidatus Brocadiia bacterium]|nr:hypothetical protein [Candidatus Brocadiia bacterium]